MGGLVSYFSRGGWKGSGSESVQDLVGEQHGETSLTNPLFTLNKSSPTHSSKPSEMVSLPPDRSSPIDSSRKSSPPSPDNTDHDHEVTVPIDEVDFHKEQPSTVDDGNELFVEKDIVITPLEDGDRFQEINTLVSSILRIYKPIAERRVLIKKGIFDFKEELGLSSSSTFIKCFSTIRAKVPNSMRVELLCAGTEPIKIKIEVVPGQSPNSSDQHVLSEDVRKSIMALNSALGFCQKYKGEKELKHADIQCKLDDLHLMPLTRDGQVLFDACNCAPTYLEEISVDIEKFHQQLYEARNLLRLS